MSKNKNRRPQTSKPAKSGNREMMYAFQDLRRSSATSRHGTVKDYRRKPKHANKGWD
jgi:hypothetical protein